MRRGLWRVHEVAGGRQELEKKPCVWPAILVLENTWLAVNSAERAAMPG